ncbi:tyrosine-protein phosphatase [Streptomyces sp. NPDC001709]
MRNRTAPLFRRAVATGAVGAALLSGMALGTVPAQAQPRPAAAVNVKVRVADVLAVRVTNGDYRLTWTASVPDVSTRIYVSTDPALRPGHRNLVTVTSGTDTTVQGLDPLRRWYFAVVPDGGAATVTAARTVTLDGVANSRDLGGYPAAHGLRIHWGTVFRSGRLTPSSDLGRQQLAALGLTEVVDFRSTAEAAREGLDPLPDGTVHIADPVGDPDQAVPPTTPPSDDPIADNYRLFVSNPNLRRQFTDGLLRAADPDQRPLMFHCTGGNHRTGWMTVVLLKALGVPDAVVRQDYLLSTGTSEAYLNAAYDEIQRDYGSFSAYLSSGLGISPGTVARLRATLLVRS